jgi:HlyD family secretion protein
MATHSALAKFLTALLLAGALGALSYGAWRVLAKDDDATVYRLAKVERGPITARVSATGTLNAMVTVQVGSQLSGSIKAIYADFNSEVKKGQVIARLDPEIYEFRVKQSQADLEAAKSALPVAENNVLALKAELVRAKLASADARRDYERKKSLVERAFITASEGDKAQAAYEQSIEQVHIAEAQIGVQEAQVESARANVRQREAALSQTRVDLDRTTIRAPVDGVVISRNVDAGQIVAASLQAPLFTIAKDLREMQVDTSIDEGDVGRLRLGQAATFTVDAFPRRNFEGKIVQIRKSPQLVQSVVTYTVVVSAPNPDLVLLPGMTANVRIVTESHPDALKVPNAALRFRPAGPEGASDPRIEVVAPGQGLRAAGQLRERLLAELELDAAQKHKLGAMLAETRQKISGLRELQNESERRKHAERVRRESRERMAALMTPEQLPAFERIMAEVGGGVAPAGRVWLPTPSASPTPVDVRIGLSDDASAEVVSGNLSEGTEIIVGTVRAAPPPRAAGGSPGLLR